MGERLKALDRVGFLNRAVIREVPLPDGSLVCIRALSASTIVAGADSSAGVFETSNLIVQSLCDMDGTLLLGESDKSAVMNVDHMALKTILEAVLELNGLKDAGAEKN